MKLQIVFSSLVLAVGMIPNASFAQGNCNAATVTPVTTCIFPQNTQGTLFTMVYRLDISGAANASCLMNRTTNNDDWHFASYIQAFTNESNSPGHQPRPYLMAAPYSPGQNYTITNTPKTFACVRNIGRNSAGALDSELSYNFANNGGSGTWVPLQYLVASGQIQAQNCTNLRATGAITAAEYATISSGCGLPPETALPVKLISFAGREASGKVALNWETATEINFSNFEIQRSQSGANFVTIGTVAAGGNNGSGNHYSFTDNSAVLSGQVYYRLKMNDIDGHVEFSSVLSIRIGAVNVAQRLFPNPVTEGRSPTLAIQSAGSQQATITVNSLNGAQISVKSVRLAAGTQVIGLDSAALPRGQYLVIVRTASGEATTHKLIVQ